MLIMQVLAESAVALVNTAMAKLTAPPARALAVEGMHGMTL
jgi:hypothetical protein